MSVLADHLSEPALWSMIEIELAAWKRAGQAPLMWWRDDDARVPTGALDRLLALSAGHQAPVALAIIPDVDLTALAARIAGHPLVTPIQHGCDHLDRNRGGGVSSEFGANAPVAEIAETINAAWSRLSAAASQAAPIYAPPWNVITPNVVAALAQTPLGAVSLYGGSAIDLGPLIGLNTHIDIMRWRPGRFRGGSEILLRLWRQLRARRKRRAWSEPVGLLTHHKNLDPDAWAFLERFLERAGRPGSSLRWRAATAFLPTAAPGP